MFYYVLNQRVFLKKELRREFFADRRCHARSNMELTAYDKSATIRENARCNSIGNCAEWDMGMIVTLEPNRKNLGS